MEVDVDIKGMTDKLQQGDGCSLKNVVRDMNFDEQEGVFEALRAEAMSRHDTRLSFEKKQVPITLPDGKDTGERIPVLDIRQDGSLLFEAFKAPGQDTVYGACKPGKGQTLPELEIKQ